MADVAQADPYDQHGFAVRVEWGPHGLRRLAASCDAIVVVDVLSFTTAIDVAVGRGATVYPYKSHDGSEDAYAAERDAEVAGPNRRFSLRPSSLLDIDAGTRIVLPSPNGSALAFGARENGAGAVYAACLRNASAVAAAVAGHRTVGIVPAGERWRITTGPIRPALEDWLGAGAVATALHDLDRSPEAEAAAATFQAMAGRLHAVLDECASGRELHGRGRGDDVALASSYDVSAVAPRLVDEAFGP